MVCTVSPGYFETVGLALRDGRPLSAADGPATPLVVVVSEGIAMAVAGVLVGAVAGVVLGRLLRSQLYGVGAADPATLAVIAAGLGAAALAARWVPALRALRTDPVSILRE